MSRIGKAPVAIPAGVEVKLDGHTLTVKGPKGQLVREFHPDMIIEIEDNEVIVKRPSENKEHKSLHGLTRALIANMVTGVNSGFEKERQQTGHEPGIFPSCRNGRSRRR